MRIKMLMGLVLMGALVATRTNAQQDSMKPKTQQANGDVRLARPLAKLGVYDARTSDAIVGAEVSDQLTSLAKITQDVGFVTLDFLTPVMNFYFIEVRKVGYAPQTLKVRVDTIKDLMVFLDPAPLGGDSTAQALPAVVTTAKAVVNAAQERAKSFDGKVLTIDDLAPEYQNLPIGKVLERKGMTPEFTVTHRANKGFKNAGGGDCKPRILLNGDEAAGSLLDLNNDPTSSFTAVEFYPTAARAPKQFLKSWSTSCGVIIFWSTKPR